MLLGIRAWLAFKEANILFEEVVVDIRIPQRFANLAKIAELSPPSAVPVLVCPQRPVEDAAGRACAAK